MLYKYIGRAISYDIANVHYRCKNEVLDERIAFFTCLGNGLHSAEGFDFKHESTNKNMKQLMSHGGTPTQFIWGAFAAELSKDVRDTICREGGLTNRDAKSRGSKDLEEDKHRLAVYLWQERVCRKGGSPKRKDEDRVNMERYDGLPLHFEASANYLLKEGNRRLDVFLAKLIHGEQFTYPRAVSMTESEDKGVKVYESFEADDEEEEEVQQILL